MKLLKGLKKSENIVFIAIIVGILGAVVITGFFVWGEIKSFNTKQEIVDTPSDNSWKIYTDDDYFYSIKYPVDWNINNWSNMIQVLAPGEEATGNYSSGPAISMLYVDQVGRLGIDVESIIFVNNMELIKQEYKSGYEPYINLYFPRPEGGFIKMYWPKSLENKYQNFWPIVESMTILNDDSPEWELYIDHELGISFSYPKLKWGKINISFKEKDDRKDNILQSGKAKIIQFNKYYSASLSAFSDDFTHMYYSDNYLGGQDLSVICTNEGILTDAGICKNINVGSQSTYENIVDFGYECSFVDARQIRLNLNTGGYSGLLISQTLPSSQACGSTEIESLNGMRREKDLTDQYNRENLTELDLRNLELMDKVLASFKFLN